MERTRGKVRWGFSCVHGALAALLLLGGAHGLSWAQGARPESLFTAEGLGVIVKKNHARARDKAIVNSLRGCVEQAVVDLVEPDLILNNYPLIASEILGGAEGYIRRYRIFHEEAVPKDDVYRVAVQATIAQGLLKSDLQAMGLYVERRGKPKVMVLIEEVAAPDGAEAPAGNPSRRAVVEHFRGRGFPLVESPGSAEPVSSQALAGNTQAAATLGQKAGAQVVLLGKTVLRRIVPVAGGTKPSYQATISVRAVDAGEGRVVAVGSDSAVALPDDADGPAAVVRKAASKVAAFMADQLLIQWKVEETASTTVTLAIEKVSVSDLARLKGGLRNSIRGVRQLVQRRYSAEGALVEVDYTGDAAQLADAMSQTRFGLFNVQVVGVGPQRIDVQIVP